MIAAFLNRETARIDALVERKLRLIELLREERAAIIARAVTRGLNPDVPMKDSGVEWLGDVPEHWTFAPLRFVATFQRGHDLPDGARRPGHIPVISSGGVIDTHDTAMASGPGIVTGRYGTIGKFYIVEGSYWPLNTALYTINTWGNHVRFLWYMVQSLAPPLAAAFP